MRDSVVPDSQTQNEAGGEELPLATQIVNLEDDDDDD
jgi:hypothetical protein